MLKMFVMRFNAHLDTSHHGSPHPYKDAEVVAGSLTGIHKAMVKCLFIVNRTAYTRVSRCPHRQKSRGFKSLGAWRSCSGSSSTYPSVMIGVIENISHSTAKMCRSTIMHVLHPYPDCLWDIFQ
jgi:hypothetical protein